MRTKRYVRKNLTPRQLDWLLNGVPVYIRRRPDGTLYATSFDFSKFLPGEEPEATLRLRFDKFTPADWVPEEDPKVLEKLEEMRRCV